MYVEFWSTCTMKQLNHNLLLATIYSTYQNPQRHALVQCSSSLYSHPTPANGCYVCYTPLTNKIASGRYSLSERNYIPQYTFLFTQMWLTLSIWVVNCLPVMQSMSCNVLCIYIIHILWSPWQRVTHLMNELYVNAHPLLLTTLFDFPGDCPL